MMSRADNAHDISSTTDQTPSSPNEAQIEVSPQALSQVRVHVKQIDGLLQGRASPKSDPVKSQVSETPELRSPTKTLTQDDADLMPSEEESEREKTQEGRNSFRTTRSGRGLIFTDRGDSILQSVPASPKRRPGPYTFTLLKNFSREGAYQLSMVEIADKSLLKMLSEARRKTRPTYYRDGREHFPEILLAPFEAIIWIYDCAREMIESGNSMFSSETSTDLKELLDLVKEDQSIKGWFEKKSKRPGQIAWQYLWTLFPPGTEVVTRLFLDIPQIMAIIHPPCQDTDVEGYSSNDNMSYNARWAPSTCWLIKAWSYDHNGISWLRVCHKVAIEKYSGERPIHELKCHPLSRNTESTNLRKECVRVGEQFAGLFSPGPLPRFLYKNQIMVDKMSEFRALLFIGSDQLRTWFRRQKGDDRKIKLIAQRIEQEVIVDPEPWNERYGTVHIGSSEPITIIDTPEEELSDSVFTSEPKAGLLHLCPPRFLGCLPKDRYIGQFKVSAIDTGSVIGKNEDMFQQRLQLGHDQKTLLLAQVNNQQDDSALSMDIIPGKGNNLVILLHGPPGVGKTLTAETVAQATGKPLLNATFADINLNSYSVEQQLSRMFATASRWKVDINESACMSLTTNYVDMQSFSSTKRIPF